METSRIVLGLVLLFAWILVCDHFQISGALRMGVQLVGTVGFVLWNRNSSSGSGPASLVGRRAPALQLLQYVRGHSDAPTLAEGEVAVLLFWASPPCVFGGSAVPSRSGRPSSAC